MSSRNNASVPRLLAEIVPWMLIGFFDFNVNQVSLNAISGIKKN